MRVPSSIPVRGYVWAILFVAVLVTPFVVRLAITDSPQSDQPQNNAAVRTLVVITPHNQDIRREFARAFDAWHASRYGQAVEIDFRVPGGTHDIKRQLVDTYQSWQT